MGWASSGSSRSAARWRTRSLLRTTRASFTAISAAPQLYPFANFWHSYQQRDYAAAATLALQMGRSVHHWPALMRTVAYGQLQRVELASEALAELLAIRTDFGTEASPFLEKWFLPEMVEHVLEGLRKAGLAVSAP